MAHTISATVLVDCPFSAVVDVLTGVFRKRRYGGWAIVDDVEDVVRRHDAIAIDWSHAHSPLPSFRGRITIRPHFRKSRMRISGTGNLFALLALNRFAHELAEAIELGYLVYLQEIRTPSADGHAGGKGDQILRSH